ncbi:hypothetical protein AB0J38_19485 [Streptomyces sp. NPDC050095]|uniref:hypothetical protein n=1 Tax=unclassified Streptomyces TaxID=2593676 RepID=UPI0034232810
MTWRRHRRSTGTGRLGALRRARERTLRRHADPRPPRWHRRLGNRAERARPWLQLLTDLATLLARVVR